MVSVALSLVFVVVCLHGGHASPILGVFPQQQKPPQEFVPAVSPSSARDYSYLVVTTTESSAPSAPITTTTTQPSTLAEDIVPLDSNRERSQFLVTLLMLESLEEKPGVSAVQKSKLKADEEVMTEILKLYEETQEKEGKHYIKIPPKLMKKMRKKMKELLAE